MRRVLLAISFLLVAAAPAHADAIIVMIAATPTRDGVLTVPVGGDAAFAVAAINVGDASVANLYFSLSPGPEIACPVWLDVCSL